MASLKGQFAKQCCLVVSTSDETSSMVECEKEYHDQTENGSLMSTTAIKINCNTTSSTSITSEESTESSHSESETTTKNVSRIFESSRSKGDIFKKLTDLSKVKNIASEDDAVCSLFFESQRDHYGCGSPVSKATTRTKPCCLELYLQADAAKENSAGNIVSHKKRYPKTNSEVLGVEAMIEKLKLCSADVSIRHPARSKSPLESVVAEALSELLGGKNNLQQTKKKQNVGKERKTSSNGSEHFPAIPKLITFEATRIPSSLEIQSLSPRLMASAATDPSLVEKLSSKNAPSEGKDSCDLITDHPKPPQAKVQKFKTNAPNNDVFDRLYNSRRKSIALKKKTMDKETAKVPFKKYHYKEYRTVHSIRPEDTKNIYHLSTSTNHDNKKSKKIKSTTPNDVFDRLYNSRKPALPRKIESTQERMILW